MSSKMEITLKSATLPRPRKTSKAEISMTGSKSSGAESPFAFKSELEAKIDAFQPQKLRTQRSEVAFPVAAAVPQTNRSSSLEPETRPRNIAPKERIIPIQVYQIEFYIYIVRLAIMMYFNRLIVFFFCIKNLHSF